MEQERRRKDHSWTPEEENILRRDYAHNGESAREIGNRFGVTPAAIREKIHRMGLSRPSRVWTRDQIRYLTRYYSRLPTETIAKFLGKSVNAVELKARRINISKRNRSGCFTLEEVCRILGVDRKWVIRRLKSGSVYLKKVRFGNNNDSHWVIREEDLKTFIRKYPDELMGRNVDMVMIVDILAGVIPPKYVERGFNP